MRNAGGHGHVEWLWYYWNRYCISILVTHLRVTRIRAYRASAHTQGPIGWEPQGVVPYDRAGPPGAIYSSNRGAGACWNTLPQSRERRGTGKQKREKKKEHRRGWAASLGPIRGTHREKVITKCTGNDRNELLEQICQLVLITHLHVTRIRAYLASSAGPPGAIYSSNRGLPEHRDLLGSNQVVTR